MRNEILKRIYRGEEISREEAEEVGSIWSCHNNFPFRYSFESNSQYSFDPPSFSLFLGCGDSADVYTLGNDNSKAIKIYNDHHPEWRMIEFFNNQKKMKKKFGDTIPDPTGLFNVFDWSKRKFHPSFIMERCYGTSLDIHNSKFDVKKILDKNNLRERIETEWNRMKDAGHKSYYKGIPFKNIIYNFGTDTFKFIDFDRDEINFD